MELDWDWLKQISGVIAQHGPWAILAFYLVNRLLTLPKIEKEMIAAYHTAIVENTRVTERLATLIEERTQRVSDRKANGH